ncbi:hypothetical protein BC936DRAFT_144716 [Jimgerdemannia flammicorona]|uniref:Uncharacterized protein n=2 Tax=Jimgerdemannia flammicorona TaxID=994334 RepID=A0A433QSK1_9FUNG|nr:hypothetical protein BC936DRAFT_144716 [Jimgerdemannia flammicorona]RUS32727.1 hypothetical protein BC938DRAFT_474493 [Jimgerdemannia flammicorona]
MANTSAKRIAADNKKTLANLQRGFIAVNIFYILWRVIFYWSTFSFSHFLLYGSTVAVTLYLYNLLYGMGNPVYLSDGSLAKSGDDINGEGLVAYFFDIIYVTWFVHVTTALISDKLWWLMLSIPAYAVYKGWGFIAPYLFSGSSASEGNADDTSAGGSKRQQKLQKRQESGQAPRAKIARR